MSNNLTEDKNLHSPVVEEIKKELDLGDPSVITINDQEKTDIEQVAAEYLNRLFEQATETEEQQQAARSAVEGYGVDLQQQSASQSKMLKGPIKDISQRADDGGEVSKSLIDLKMTVEDLDPSGFNFEAGWFSRLMGFLPFIGTPVKRYFSKFESAETLINAIIASLEQGKDQLNRDNITLNEDQKRMRELSLRLERAVKIGQVMDQKIEYMIERDFASDEAKKKFVQEELLFPLRQRVIDLQQQVAVNQQGVISTEIIMRNNKELIRGVNRALNVTVAALDVAVTTALALADQKIVLEKVNALKSTTDNLIAGNAKRLKEQGAQIQKEATSSALDIETLKVAFEDIKTALNDISTFKQEALPLMKNSVKEMDQLIATSEESIQNAERANKVNTDIKFEL